MIATGRITSYPGKSTYQIVIDALEPAGIGALMALLEERKKKLAAEGLFDEARKKKLPYLPRVIGIVTSPTGAVIRDMLHGFDERFPARVLLWPVRVQGETCAAEVAAAIRGFNALPPGGPLPRPDVLIVARGGGSLEDLWGFNEEMVVRAAAASAIPLISAVGHETDWTLIDLAADARAPTPTKAAEWAVPKYSELIEQTGKLALRLGTAARRALDGMRAHLRAAARGLPRRGDLLALPRQRFDAVDRRLGRALLANTRAHGVRLARCVVAPAAAAAGGAARRARATGSRRWAGAPTPRWRAGLAPRRARLERVAGRLGPQPIVERIARCSERAGRPGRRARASPCWRASPPIGAISTPAPSCWPRSATRACCSAAMRWCATARAARCARPQQVAAGQRLDIELADGHVDAQALGGGAPRARRAAAASATEPAAAQDDSAARRRPGLAVLSGCGPDPWSVRRHWRGRRARSVCCAGLSPATGCRAEWTRE